MKNVGKLSVHVPRGAFFGGASRFADKRAVSTDFVQKNARMRRKNLKYLSYFVQNLHFDSTQMQ
jgi:hypothetical protein